MPNEAVNTRIRFLLETAVRLQQPLLSLADTDAADGQPAAVGTARELKYAMQEVVKHTAVNSLGGIIRAALAYPTHPISRHADQLRVPVRPFAADMLVGDPEQATTFADVITREGLLPAPEQSVFFGNGTTVYRLARQLLEQGQRWKVYTTSFELACLHYYAHAGRGHPPAVVLGQRELDRRTGAIGERDAVEVYDTAVLSFHSYVRGGDGQRRFFSRDESTRASNERAAANALRRVVLIASRDKIDRHFRNGSASEPLRLPSDKEVVLVTDELEPWGEIPGIRICSPLASLTPPAGG
jgi:hypothetical protein